MASRQQTTTELFRYTMRSMEKPPGWTTFLHTAAWNYKYSFADQILIYAQKPDATACAEMEEWNQKVGRWVNKKAKSIALLDDKDENLKLRYVFDISDTNGGKENYNRRLILWAMQDKYQEQVIEILENRFGALEMKEDFVHALLSATHNAVEDNYLDYLEELMAHRSGSFLEDLDEERVKVMFYKVAEYSAAHMVLTRCGYPAEEYFPEDYFKDICNFNTPASFSRLGAAVSDISEILLRSIEITVKKLKLQEKEKKQSHTFAKQKEIRHNKNIENETERKDRYDNHLHGERRIYDTRSDHTAGEQNNRQVRQNEKKISPRTPTGDVYRINSDRPTGASFSGDRSNRQPETRPDGGRNEETEPDNRRTQSPRSDEMGRNDEQRPERSGGNHSGGTNLQQNLKEQEKISEEAEAGQAPASSDFQEETGQTKLPLERSEPTEGGLETTISQTIGDIYRAYEPTIVSLCIRDEAYLKAREGFQDEDKAKKECYAAIDRAVLSLQEKAPDSLKGTAPDFVNLYRDGTFASRLRNRVFDTTYTQYLKIAQKVERMGQQKKTTPEQQNFQVIKALAPEVLTGESTMIQFTAGAGMMPLYIQRVRENRIEVSHIQDEYGFVDPKMGFVFDLESETLSARTFQQYSPTVNQNVENEEGQIANVGLANELNSFARQWFSNIKQTGYHRKYMKAISLGTELTVKYGIGGQIYTFAGWDNSSDQPLNEWRKAVRHYAEQHGLSYDLMFGYFGNGLTVCNRLEEEHNDYKTIAHISDTGKITYYQDVPDFIKAILEQEAQQHKTGVEDSMQEPIPEEKTLVQPEEKADESQAEKPTEDKGVILSFPSPKTVPDFTPSVKIIWSEYSFFEEGEILPFGIANAAFKAIDTRVKRTKEEIREKGKAVRWEYFKTRFEISWTIDGETFTYQGRQDFGDGDGDIISHIKDFANGVLTSFLLRQDLSSEQVEELRSIRDEFVPFLNQYKDVSESEWTEFQERYQRYQEQEDLWQSMTFLPNNKEPQSEESSKLRLDPKPEFIDPARINFHITDDQLGVGGAKTKYAYNIAAIRLLKTLEAEKRLATPEEQELLSRYVGWGSLPEAFDTGNTKWQKEYVELNGLLTEEEYKSVRASTLNAHYTPPMIIRAMYETIERMGFQKGRVADFGCGIGNFFGMLPENMEGSQLYGVELDSITGRIAQQLYQKSNITIRGFEESDFSDSFFDLAIGNVPFGSYGVSDPRYDKHKFLIHDYFFAKALDKVRPGGVVAFITSKGTMDKKDSEVRRYLAQRAELLGAIRLPNNAFSANAGTEVTSDILFLQKREQMEPQAEPDWIYLSETENGIPINRYFAEHPEMVLGTMVWSKNMYGNEKETACLPLENADLAKQLQEVTSHIQGEIPSFDLDDLGEEKATSIPADPNVRNFSFTIIDDVVYYRENDVMNPVDVSLTGKQRIKGLIAIRDCVRQLIQYQMEDAADEVIQEQQKQLNTLYDTYTQKYDLLTSRGNKTAFGEDSSYPLLCSLEILNDEGKLKRKADLFSKRTIRRPEPVTHVDTPSDALILSMSEKARIDLPYMIQLTGLSEETLLDRLSGIVFRDFGDLKPEDISYDLFDFESFPLITAEEYLSGNVREKLKQARGLYDLMKQYGREEIAEKLNVQVCSLEAVQPEDLKAGEISVRLGATWVPPDIVRAFIFDLLEPEPYKRNSIRVLFTDLTKDWDIEGKNRDYFNIKATNTYGTKRVNAYQIIEDILNLRDTRIYDSKRLPDGKLTYVLNPQETRFAQQRQQMVKDAFQDWVWKEPDRREQLVRIYNERFNGFRPRQYDGSHLKFPGMNIEKTLRPHQLNAVARILYGGNTLLAHVVGAGKTYEMIAAAMESKRLGLCQKPLFVVPNHLTEQWAASFLELYPSANILVATKKDFEMQNRKKFCSRIATGTYDAVIIGHSQFEKIPMSEERQRKFVDDQIDELTDTIQELKGEKEKRTTVKNLERAKKSLQVKLMKLLSKKKKDNVVFFEELGVDRLFIDEAHHYKNLFFTTKMTRVAGVSTTGADKSMDLFLKCQYLDELTDSRGTIFATGTPVSNSMTELYTLQRYLQYQLLRKNNLTHFDAWASSFGENVTALELAPEGKGLRLKTRFARFYNLPELMSLFRLFADVQTSDMLNLPVPKAIYHNVSVKPSEFQQKMVNSLVERAKKVRNGNVNPRMDNMLLITNDGRKLALDQRLLNDLLPDNEHSKVNACANNVLEMWANTKKERSTQLVFCDLSTPKEDGSFNVYDDLKQKLIACGIPEEEIALIHDAHTEIQKAALFARVRNGKIRVLIGSTPRMGAGTNVQDKLIATHDLDCPWRPSDLEQRSGRIIRQGNQNPEVHVSRYVTEGTFDAYLYQLIESKQRIISQIMTSKTPIRVAEDIDEISLSFAEIKALASGDPRILEHIKLQAEIAQLQLVKASYLNLRYELQDKLIRYFPQEIQRLKDFLQVHEKDCQYLQQNQPEGERPAFCVTIQGQTYTDKKEAGKALLDVCTSISTPDTAMEIGSYRGFRLELSFISKSYYLELVQKGRYGIHLGKDMIENLTHMEQELQSLSESFEEVKAHYTDTMRQMENAKAEVKAPFPQEQELEQKKASFQKLDAELNLGQQEIVVMDDPEEDLENPTDKQEESKGNNSDSAQWAEEILECGAKEFCTTEEKTSVSSHIEI